MNWGIFWGILLVILGLSLIIKVVFNVEIPVVKFLIGFFFIYLGIKMFIGKDFHLCTYKNTENTVVFGQKTIYEVTNEKEYNVVFGKGIIDLSSFTVPDSGDKTIRLNTVFGSSDVLLNDSVPVKIKSTSAFAETQLPDGNTTAFGTLYYKSDSADIEPTLHIESTTVFGNTFFRNKRK